MWRQISFLFSFHNKAFSWANWKENKNGLLRMTLLVFFHSHEINLRATLLKSFHQKEIHWGREILEPWATKPWSSIFYQPYTGKNKKSLTLVFKIIMPTKRIITTCKKHLLKKMRKSFIYLYGNMVSKNKNKQYGGTKKEYLSC